MKTLMSGARTEGFDVSNYTMQISVLLSLSPLHLFSLLLLADDKIHDVRPQILFVALRCITHIDVSYAVLFCSSFKAL